MSDIYGHCPVLSFNLASTNFEVRLVHHHKLQSCHKNNCDKMFNFLHMCGLAAEATLSTTASWDLYETIQALFQVNMTIFVQS